MRIPTFKAMQEVFENYTEENHAEFKRILSNPLDGTSERERECYNPPDNADVALHYLDKILGAYGVEGLTFTGQYKDGLSYLNFGDPYAQTVCYRSDTKHFFLGTWGDWAERHPGLVE